MDYMQEPSELPQPQMYNYAKYTPTQCNIWNKQVSKVNVTNIANNVIKKKP